ncbi:MAG: hypothetical protein K9L17_13150 [Clostridiales bacterium]|nr:hypothetical protein [Clostridiales bacterium]MCF8023626.1 hypothetical protein [Clostridiales bacterium]
MRVIGKLPDKSQVGFLVDSLRKTGFDRSSMIISDADATRDDYQEAAGEVSYIKTEREGLGESGEFAESIKDFDSGNKNGVIIAVEASSRKADRVKEIMEESGAVDITRD